MRNFNLAPAVGVSAAALAGAVALAGCSSSGAPKAEASPSSTATYNCNVSPAQIPLLEGPSAHGTRGVEAYAIFKVSDVCGENYTVPTGDHASGTFPNNKDATPVKAGQTLTVLCFEDSKLAYITAEAQGSNSPIDVAISPELVWQFDHQKLGNFVPSCENK